MTKRQRTIHALAARLLRVEPIGPSCSDDALDVLRETNLLRFHPRGYLRLAKDAADHANYLRAARRRGIRNELTLSTGAAVRALRRVIDRAMEQWRAFDDDPMSLYTPGECGIDVSRAANKHVQRAFRQLALDGDTVRWVFDNAIAREAPHTPTYADIADREAEHYPPHAFDQYVFVADALDGLDAWKEGR